MAQDIDDTADDPVYEHDATYSPEDNKLRLYASRRLSAEEYARAKSLGFKWAPKQELFVAPAWSPDREDLLLEWCGEIGDEGYSYEERAADRAERFDGYRGKRSDEAHDSADRFDDGPAAFGHQNRRRAERQAARHDRHRTYGLTQWGKAEYWQERTAGVIRHALHKSDPRTRRGRILTLEAEQRKHLASIAQAVAERKAWQRVADEPDAEKATELARRLANVERGCWDYQHPRQDRKASFYTLLDADQPDPITGHEAAALYLNRWSIPNAPGSRSDRWAKHYELRLTYERAMLAEEGGTAAEAEIEPGGWFGSHQVLRVYKSPATGRVTSCAFWGPHPWRRNADGTSQMGPQTINIERLAADAYRPPTDEERAAFASKQKAEKKAAKAEKAGKPKPPALVNPTKEDAERLQAILNAAASAEHTRKASYSKYEAGEVMAMTQAKYSDVSKGAHSSFETWNLHANGALSRKHHDKVERYGPIVCKLRARCGRSWYGAECIVVLTDKPQKPLPFDQIAEPQEQQAEAC